MCLLMCVLLEWILSEFIQIEMCFNCPRLSVRRPKWASPFILHLMCSEIEADRNYQKQTIYTICERSLQTKLGVNSCVCMCFIVYNFRKENVSIYNYIRNRYMTLVGCCDEAMNQYVKKLHNSCRYIKKRFSNRSENLPQSTQIINSIVIPASSALKPTAGQF